MPNLAFQGKNVGKLAKNVNIIGVGNVTVDEEGNVTLRLGQNLNSSLFHDTDGTTTGTVAATTGTITGTRVLADGTSKAIWLKGTNTVTVATAGQIHFDDNATATFQLKVNDKTFTFGPIIGDGTYGTDTNVAKLVVSGFGTEANTATGATGYSGKIAITFNAGAMEFEDGYVSVELKQTAGTAGATKVFNKSNLFYLVNDTATKADVTEATVALSNITTKTLSGVSYITGATVSYGATIANVGNPATKAASTSPVMFANDVWAAGNTANVTYNATTATATATLINGQFAAADTTVEVSAQNINGKGTKATASLNKALLVDSTVTTGATDTFEPFNDEARRINAKGAAWISTASLADGAAGSEGLMIAKGQLIYPAGDFTGTNDGLGGIVGSAQPIYTGKVSGTRTYIRKLYKDASMPGGTIQINSSASLESAINEGTLKIEIAKAQPTGDATDVWYDICFRTVGAQPAKGIGKSNTVYGTLNKLVYEFSDGNANKDLWIRITMTADVAVLKDITLL